MIGSRRAFLRTAVSVGSAAVALRALSACASPGAATAALKSDPHRILDLPNAFSYAVLSRTGDAMSDGLFEPAAHDGMAAFPVAGDAERCILVRNHEIGSSETGADGAFGRGFANASKVDIARAYDRTPSGFPHLGGTTTLLVNVKKGLVERSHLSLAGTIKNCSGGPTPWGSWLSCEETLTMPGAQAQKAHGFTFEVPANQTKLIEARPLKAMGRFNHEAAAVDPVTGVVYQTEDDGDGLFYRFLPAARGELHQGGKLQVLAIVGKPGAHTGNKAGIVVERGKPLAVTWIDLDHVESPDGDLTKRGHAAGAAFFARGEGMSTAIENGKPVIYFACTSGGVIGKGQIFRYIPSRFEGQSAEAGEPGKIELFVESQSDAVLDYPDNIIAAPWGDLIICEDGEGENFVRGVTPAGGVYPIARNALPEKSEFCGVCFSPDGSTMYVNIQRPGMTVAITGPWKALSKAAAA